MGINALIHRDRLKSNLSIPPTETTNDGLLDAAIDAVSRTVEQYLGFTVFPSVATQYYTAKDARCLILDQPLLAVTSINTDPGGDSSYELAMSSTCYWLTGPGQDYNVRENSPPQPYWEIHTRFTSTAYFPEGIPRGVQITGTWGYYDEHTPTTATLATGANATVGTLALNGATAVHAGQTILLGSEQIYVQDVVATASSASVQRGVNGTNAATHSSGAAIETYNYPVIEEAVLFQAGMDFRSAQMPMGYAGGDAGGSQRMGGSVGLHPFARKLLEPLRKPVAR